MALTICFDLGVAQPLRSGVEVVISEGNIVASWSYDNSRAVNPVPAQYFIATVSQDGMQIGTTFMIDVNTESVTIPGSLFQAESTYIVSVIVRNLQGDSEPISEPVTIPVGFNSALGKSQYNFKLGACF